jgi:hypothetical protein
MLGHGSRSMANSGAGSVSGARGDGALRMREGYEAVGKVRDRERYISGDCQCDQRTLLIRVPRNGPGERIRPVGGRPNVFIVGCGPSGGRSIEAARAPPGRLAVDSIAPPSRSAVGPYGRRVIIADALATSPRGAWSFTPVAEQRRPVGNLAARGRSTGHRAQGSCTVQSRNDDERVAALRRGGVTTYGPCSFPAHGRSPQQRHPPAPSGLRAARRDLRRRRPST